MEWNYTLDVADAFADRDVSFAERRDIVVRRIREADFCCDAGTVLVSIVERLENSRETDAFNDAWSDFYDWADENRVWIQTF